MELLKLLLIINLIFITVKTATGKNLPAEVDDIYKQSIKLLRYDINLTLYTNENDYKNTHIYKTFKSYIDEQQEKGNFIFYGESTIFFKILNTIDKIQLHIGNLKIDETATKIITSYEGENLSETPTLHMYNDETIILFVSHNFPNQLHYTYRIIMKFVGSITDNIRGFFTISYKNNNGEKQ